MWVVIAAFVTGLAGTTKADEISELRKEVERQYNALLKVQSKLLELESTMKQQGTAIQSIEQTGGMGMPETLAWVQNVQLYGDFRYRFEWVDRDGRDRTRHRLRARIGVKGKINDEMTYNVRLATGEAIDILDESSPTSTNQTLENWFSQKNFWLDRAYLSWKPASVCNLEILIGKMGNPFYMPGSSQLIWDSDLNPEGAAFHYGMDLTEADSLFFTGGVMALAEESSGSDIYMWAAQAGLEHTFDDGSKLAGGVTYYDYMNIEGASNVFGDLYGNTDGGGTTYAYDYDIWNLFGEFSMKIDEMPVTVYGDFVNNAASGVSDGQGWLIGATFNKAKDPGTWAIDYSYRDVGKDAVVAAFTQGDFNGSDVRGHSLGINYALAKNTTVGATYYLLDPADNTRDDQMIQVDLVVKF